MLVLVAVVGLALVGVALRLQRLERQRREQPDELELPNPSVSKNVEELAVESSRAEFTTPELASPAPEPAEPIANVRQLKHAATLLRDLNGKLVVEIDGEQYRSGTEINDFVVRSHLEAALDDLQRMLYPQGRAGVVAATQTEQPDSQAAAEFLSEQEKLMPQRQDDRPAVKKISLEEDARKPVQKPSLNVFEQWRTLQDREAEPEIQIKTVLDEIDEVVQVRLKGTHLVNRGLRVSTDPVTGAARFHLEGQTYSDVEQVPDLDAQDLFRARLFRVRDRVGSDRRGHCVRPVAGRHARPL